MTLGEQIYKKTRIIYLGLITQENGGFEGVTTKIKFYYICKEATVIMLYDKILLCRVNI